MGGLQRITTLNRKVIVFEGIERDAKGITIQITKHQRELEREGAISYILDRDGLPRISQDQGIT